MVDTEGVGVKLGAKMLGLEHGDPGIGETNLEQKKKHAQQG
jgi:hypothetical protein